LFEERFLSLAKDRLATEQIAKTEQQLQSAMEEEDYGSADQLLSC
jgi:predicted HD phosphohydrolase